jgi:hypothetical protein
MKPTDEGRTMKTRRIACAALGVLVAMAGTVATTHAAAVSAVPVAGTTSTVSVSIFQKNADGTFSDISDTYLPEWAPNAPLQVVYVVVNNSTATPTLVAPTATAPSSTNRNPFLTALTTSAYPGNCTNVGTDAGPDFTFDPATPPAGLPGAIRQNLTLPTGVVAVAYPLISNDCGGMAVLAVGTDKVVIPRDANLNGIPDSWEAAFCPNRVCAPGDDTDTSPGNTAVGDGLAAFDEYRGFIVSGLHVRTDPMRKDLFVHLVNPQCGATSLLGGGVTTFPSDGSALFGDLDTLLSGTQIHVLGYATPGATHLLTDEWTDNFVSATYVPTSNTVTFSISNTTTDRQVNKNAVYPITDTITGNTIQKGLRVTECIDATTTSPLGSAGLGSPNGPGNAVLYTQRIVNSITSLVAAGAGKPLRAYTYTNGVATLVFQSAGAPTTADTRVIISKAVEFFLAMEMGHSVRLTPTVEGTAKTSYGYHHAPGTGSNLDQTIVNRVDTTFNNFYIPTLYNSTDTGSFKLHN